MQVQRVQAGRVVGDHGLVNVDRALRRAGRAAREVQQRRILGARVRGLEAIGDGRHPGGEVVRARLLDHVTVLGDQQHVAQRGHALAQPAHLAPVQAVGGDQHAAAAEVDPGGDRLGTERREQRRHHGAVAQRAQHRDVQLGDAPGQHEHPIAVAHAEGGEHVRKARGPPLELGEGEFERGPLACHEAQRHALAQRPARVAHHRLVRDVQAPARQALERAPRRAPGVGRPRVGGQVGRYPQLGGMLPDQRRSGHRPPPGGRL